MKKHLRDVVASFWLLLAILLKTNHRQSFEVKNVKLKQCELRKVFKMYDLTVWTQI